VVVLEAEDYEQDHEAPERELEFEWTGMMEEALCGEPSPSHRAALDLLKDRYNASNGRLSAQREEVHELRGVMERRGRSNDDHVQKMGQLDKALEKLGEKLETIIKANNLKRTPG
jgi:Arc/MetJ-type ribon-helix-helix transcriptional regulator